MKDTWYKLDMGDGITAQEPLMQIREAFENTTYDVDDPGSLAVFIRHESDRPLHCHIIAFFSPAAYELAGLMNAVPCSKPSQSGLELVAGNYTCWKTLFPDSDS